MLADSSHVQTMRWNNQCLEMIDQRVLPERFEYIPYFSAEGVAQGIKDMVVRGAPAIGVAAAYGIGLESLRLQNLSKKDFHAAMEQAFLVLANARPTAVNLFWALEAMRQHLEKHKALTPAELASCLMQKAHDLFADDIRINRLIGEHGAKLLKDGSRVLTHCNAGALATAGHGTALGVIRSAVESGKKISVVADETRPFLQGARLTAWEMVQESIPVTLITDNMAGYMMARGEIDAIIVGADRVARNGDVANKIGTYMVAVLAHRHQIPFYVACPISTIDMSIATGADIPIEERAENEVKGFREYLWAADGVKIRNPSFDVTPNELISAIITEDGYFNKMS
jgi:methylthioribose-1-phosphate isomerase